jgi:serine protease Do
MAGRVPAIDVWAFVSADFRRRCAFARRNTMVRYLLLVLACSAIALGAGAKDAPKAPAGSERNLPSIKFDGKHPATLRFGDLTVTLDSVPGSDADSRVPVFKGRYHDSEAFSFRVDEAERAEPESEARIMRLDPGSPLPQVVMTTFTGGAHCCTVTRIATLDGAQTWHVVDADQLDGDGYTFADVDGDGAKELISVDNSFLYAFASYAESYAPTRIAKLSGTEVKAVTREPQFRNFLRKELQKMEAAAGKDRKLWHSNGFLGGWVAAKSLVGEVDDAWKRMLASYDRKSDWPLEECATGEEIDKCPKDKVRTLSFPDALKKQLVKDGYPAPKSGQR